MQHRQNIRDFFLKLLRIVFLEVLGNKTFEMFRWPTSKLAFQSSDQLFAFNPTIHSNPCSFLVLWSAVNKHEDSLKIRKAGFNIADTSCGNRPQFSLKIRNEKWNKKD